MQDKMPPIVMPDPLYTIKGVGEPVKDDNVIPWGDFKIEAPTSKKGPDKKSERVLLAELYKRPELLIPPPTLLDGIAYKGRHTLFAGREKLGKSEVLGLLPADVLARLDVLTDRLAAERDPFGMTADGLRTALPICWALHQAWFRVTSKGIDRIPTDGPAILVANHGGLLPFDGAMLATDVLLRLPVPRVARPLVARFVEDIGPLDRFYRRTGAVMASRTEFRSVPGCRCSGSSEAGPTSRGSPPV